MGSYSSIRLPLFFAEVNQSVSSDVCNVFLMNIKHAAEKNSYCSEGGCNHY